MANTAAMIMSREEPLIKQLARSRAIHPRAASLSPTGGNRNLRSSSQPPPRHRMPFSPLSTKSQNLYQTQLLPYSLVFPPSPSTPHNMYNYMPLTCARVNPAISVSQPDLTKIMNTPPTFSPPTISRSHSPLPPSSSQCGSPILGTLSPLNFSTPSSRAQTPIHWNSPPPDLINSIYSAPADIYHEREMQEASQSPMYLRPEGNESQVKFTISPSNSDSGLAESRQRSVSPAGSGDNRSSFNSSGAPLTDPNPGHEDSFSASVAVTCPSNGELPSYQVFQCQPGTSALYARRVLKDGMAENSRHSNRFSTQQLPYRPPPTVSSASMPGRATQITFFPCPLCPVEKLHSQHHTSAPQWDHSAASGRSEEVPSCPTLTGNLAPSVVSSSAQWPTQDGNGNAAHGKNSSTLPFRLFEPGELHLNAARCAHRTGISTFAGACYICKACHFDRLTVTAPSTPTGHRSPSKDQLPNTGPRKSIPYLVGPSPLSATFGPSAASAAAGSGVALLASICSASGNSQGAIDNRIEQAMDLVKSHLMNAVRSEVEELKEKIVGLEIKIDHLQNENDILKTHAPTDVVNQLPQLAPTPPQAMMMGPPPMSGLNLAAPQPVMMSAPANGMHGPAQGPPSQGGAPTNGHTHPQTNGGTTQN